ncbi:hypothetical protein BC628DRAFT_976990 [Trametes gibbosa]|nr:hypothetical protein BC628DRAFT_976990 [Trametes gibbosa]
MRQLFVPAAVATRTRARTRSRAQGTESCVHRAWRGVRQLDLTADATCPPDSDAVMGWRADMFCRCGRTWTVADEGELPELAAHHAHHLITCQTCNTERGCRRQEPSIRQCPRSEPHRDNNTRAKNSATTCRSGPHPRTASSAWRHPSVAISPPPLHSQSLVLVHSRRVRALTAGVRTSTILPWRPAPRADREQLARVVDVVTAECTGACSRSAPASFQLVFLISGRPNHRTPTPSYITPPLLGLFLPPPSLPLSFSLSFPLLELLLASPRPVPTPFPLSRPGVVSFSSSSHPIRFAHRTLQTLRSSLHTHV